MYEYINHNKFTPSCTSFEQSSHRTCTGGGRRAEARSSRLLGKAATNLKLLTTT